MALLQQSKDLLECKSFSGIGPPNVVSHCALVILSLVVAFKSQYILVRSTRTLSLHWLYLSFDKNAGPPGIEDGSPGFVAMCISVKNIDFEAHIAAHGSVALHLSFN
ncbi:Uncharacterised protein r2_g2542 [Pycnogonum litorale]